MRATGDLPINTEPAALGKMRKIPVISWAAAGEAPRERDRDDIQSWYTGQVDETGKTFLEEDVIEWIKRDISERPTVETSPYDAPFALRDKRRVL